MRFRANVHGNDPAERARLASERLEALSQQAADAPVSTQPITLGSERGLAVLVGDRLALVLVEADAERLSGETLEPLAREVADRLSDALRASRDQRSLRLVLRSLGESGAATAVLLVVFWIVVRLRRLLTSALRGAAERRTAGLARRGIDLTPLLSAAVRGVGFVAFWSLAAVLVDVWITFVLGRFPLTAPWADVLTGRAVEVLSTFGLAVLGAVPRLATVAVILLVTRAVVGFLGGLFTRVGAGTLRVRELVARLAVDPVERPQVLSELHAHVQDAFNAAGVQIMSPHFVLQPDRPVVVPQGRWHGEPDEPERRRG